MARPWQKVSPVNIIAFCVYAVFYLAICRYSYHWLKKLDSRRGDFGFVGRKQYLIYLFAVGLLFWTLSRVIGAFLTMLGFYDLKDGFATGLATSNTVLTIISFSVSAVAFCMRIWLIFYDCSLAQSESDEKWKCRITAPVVYMPTLVGVASNLTLENVADYAAGVSGRRRLMGGMSHSSRSSRSSLQSIPSLASVLDRSQSTVHGQSDSTDGWIRYKSTWGNRRWIQIRVSCFIVPLVALNIILYASQEFEYGRYLYLFLVFCLCMFPACIAYRFPKYTDSIHIVDEVWLCFRVASVLIVMFGGSVATELIVRDRFRKVKNDDIWEKQRDIKFWLWIGSSSIFIYGSMVFLLVQTKWVYLIFPKNENEDPLMNLNNMDDDDYVDEVAISTCWTLHGLGKEPKCLQNTLDAQPNDDVAGKEDGIARSPTILPENMKHLEIRDIISDDEGFHQFMDHLFQEFSFESLLCIVEVSQFAEMFGEKREQRQISTVLGIQKAPTLNIDYTGILSTMAADANSVSTRALKKIRTISNALNPNMVTSRSSSLKDVSDLDAKQPEQLGMTKNDSDSAQVTRDSQSNNETHRLTHQKSLPAGVVDLPADVDSVHSSIVYHDVLNKEQKFCVLCQKYILHDSEMSVNISDHTRTSLIRIHDFLQRGTIPRMIETEEELEELKSELTVESDVFATVVRELLKILRDSLSRFRRKKEYLKLQKKVHLQNMRKSKERVSGSIGNTRMSNQDSNSKVKRQPMDVKKT